jgi:hypothetical protein
LQTPFFYSPRAFVYASIAPMANIPKLISKTKIMQGYQCHKNIYLSVHNKELIPPVGPDLQALFDQGHAVTIEARKRFPDGVLVDLPAWEFVASLKKTKELLADKVTCIFEAAFEYKGCYARADIITYNETTQRWSVIEVKSTTKVKDEHLDDVGLQVWIMANAGLPVEKISLMHLNNLCKYPDLSNLFIEEDVTDQLRSRHNLVAPRLNEIFKSLRSESVPDVDIGPHCSLPRDCQFMEHCWSQKNLPKKSVFSIPGLYDKKWPFYSSGQVALDEIETSQLSEKQQQCLEVLKTGKRFVDSAKIKQELSTWKFPLVFLDFETVNPAIPQFRGTGPFTQVPFQFSVHILDSLESESQHFEFLHDDETDPRPKLIPELLKACGTEGSIVAYYGKFESARIQELGDFSPAHVEALQNLRERIVDPLPIIRESVYDADFLDSYSIKSVGPALLGPSFSYAEMAVGDGSAAQRAYALMVTSSGHSERQQQIRRDLLDYCKMDTWVMVELVKWLFRC